MPRRPRIAAINSVGNLGGFVAQNAVPFIRDQTQSDLVPMLFLAACLAVGPPHVRGALRPAPRRGAAGGADGRETGLNTVRIRALSFLRPARPAG